MHGLRNALCLGWLVLVSAAAAEPYRLRDAAALPDADQAPAAKLPADAKHAFPADRAIRTLLHWCNPRSENHVPEERALPFMQDVGVNHCWGWDPGTPAPDWLNKIHLVNLTHQTGYARGEAEWFYVYLRTEWKERGEAALRFDLLERYYPKRFRLPRGTDPAITFYVEERGRPDFLDPGAYTADRAEATLTLTGGEPGRQYRAIFLANDRGVPYHFRFDLDNPRAAIADATVASVRERQLARLKRDLEAHPDVAVIRPTSEIYDRLGKVRDPDDNSPGALSHMARQSYWQTMHPDRLARFETLYGRPFDPRWIIDTGFGENGYVPPEGLMQWVDLVRNDVGLFVRQRNNLVHAHGKRVRLFFGDNFVGIEPYLGDVEYNGYDEMVMAMDGGPGLIRFITAFPGTVRRVARFQWSGTNFPAEEYAVQYRACWRWIKREALFHCMDGLTLGGVGTKAADLPPLAHETRRIFEDFQTVYDRVHGREAFTHEDFNVVVLSAWGRMRSWRIFDHYLSQMAFNRHLVDLPVKIRWLSFNEVIETGIPDNTALVILNGEPDTAWGGGRYWRDETLVAAVRRYVRDGGGLLAVGAPTLVDGEFALADVLGVRYTGAPNEACAEALWSPTRWAEGHRRPDDYPVGGVMPLAKIRPNLYTLPPELQGRFDDQGAAWTIRFPATVVTNGAAVLAFEDFEDVGDGGEAYRFRYFLGRAFKQTRTGVFINAYGRGRSVLIGGWGNTPDYRSLLKPLLFYAAGRTEALDRLNSGDPQVAVYYYPAARRLIAYNHAARRKTTAVLFDPALAGIGSGAVRLTAMDDAVASIEQDTAGLRRGFPVTLEAGQAAYWTVSAAADAD
ncbi:MAG: hypothetical protein JW951_08585 [Lentisphaerae bacterium]|nr:hypothetical protein [Lentisphaerota bacterium]